MNLTRRIIAIMVAAVYNGTGVWLLVTVPEMREAVWGGLGLGNGLILGFYFGVSKSNGNTV